jgi:hypothetical protein
MKEGVEAMTTVPGSAAQATHGPVTMPFWTLLGAGVITTLFGAAVLAWPGATLRLLGVLTGIWLLVIGVMRVAGAFRAGHDEEHTSGIGMRGVVDGAFGLLLVVVGIACLRSTATGVIAMSLLIGLAWLLSGFAGVLLGMFAHGHTRGWLLGVGVGSIVVGILFLAWPGLSLHALVLLTGITAVILGVAEIAAAIRARGHATA